VSAEEIDERAYFGGGDGCLCCIDELCLLALVQVLAATVSRN
jgi:hypothetical protein